MEKKEKAEALESEGRESNRRDFLRGAFTATGGLIVISGIATPKANLAVAREKPKEVPKDIYKYLFATRRNCTGGRACEYACSLRLEKVVRPSAAAIHIKRYWGVIDIPSIC